MDSTPAGDGTPGDNLTQYEEYRGLRIASRNPAQWARVQLDVTKKEVFVCDKDNIGLTDDLTTANLGAEVYYMSPDEVGATGAINFNSSSENCIGTQSAILVTNGITSPQGNPLHWGYTAWKATPPVPPYQDYCRVYVSTIRSTDGYAVTLRAAIPNEGYTAEIPVTATLQYRDQGKIKIGDEIIFYTGKRVTPSPAFLQCNRGQDGTATAQHDAGVTVSHFVNPDSAIRMIFAHEAGHLMNLGHREMAWHNIQSIYENAGSFDGADGAGGLFHVFRNESGDALTDRFRVKP
ncbi:MAG: hypothetical protein HY321_03725 [Armatimonadetes bacterium]|nr:hypothetical protein [Armatimonadota bacterium]